MQRQECLPEKERNKIRRLMGKNSLESDKNEENLANKIYRITLKFENVPENCARNSSENTRPSNSHFGELLFS